VVEDDDGLPGVTIEPKNKKEKRRRKVLRIAAAAVEQPVVSKEQVDAMQP